MAEHYDIDEIKSRLNITRLFELDSHHLKRSGSTLVTSCPFHDEKTPSCQVNESKSMFHCFGCSAHGDIFEYWQQSRNCDFKTALSQLASMIGLSPREMESRAIRPKTTKKPGKAEPDLPTELSGSDLTDWKTANSRLESDPEQQRKIAKWRGYSETIIPWAISKNLIGLYNYYSQNRVALLVKMPSEGELIPVASHIRLASKSKGNPNDKQSWRFSPSGCGAWPFIVGDHSKAKYLFITEGQWDALALIDLMKWHEKTEWPKHICVIGMRGASSGDKLIANYELRKDAIAFAFADADAAGSTWFFAPCYQCSLHPKNKGAEQKKQDCTKCTIRTPSFIEKLEGKIKTVHGIQPTENGCDLNDIIRNGTLTRNALQDFLKSKIPIRRSKPIGDTIIQWCKKNQDAAHPPEIIEAIHYIINDDTRPKKRKPLETWIVHWKKQNLPSEKINNLQTLWATYKNDNQITH